MPMQLINAMTYIFHDMMHDIVEDYIDDILAKYIMHEEHWDVIHKILQHLLEHIVILNPKKCIISIMLGKLLSFIISNQGIKINPRKIKAIVDIC